MFDPQDLSGTFTVETKFDPDAIKMAIDSLERIKAEYRVPKKITISRAFFDDMISKNMIIEQESSTAVDVLYGVPCEITDDPLAPNYYIDYEDQK